MIAKKTLSIDFGSRGIKIIEGKYSKNNIQVFKAIEIPIEPNLYKDGKIEDRSALADLVKNTLKENKISTDITHSVVNCSDIITREVAIPKVSEKEIASIIEYQLDDFLPVNTNDYEVRFLSLGEKDDNDMERLEIMLVAMPKENILEHFNLLKDINLKPQVLDYQGNAIAKLIRFNSTINDSYKTKDVALAAVDIGYLNSKVTIIKDGNMEISRVIDLGIKDLYENISSFFDYSKEKIEEEIMGIGDISIERDDFSDGARILNIIRTTFINLLEKIEMIFRYYTSKELGNSINYILLHGGATNIGGIENIFRNFLNIPTIKLETLDKIKWNGDLNKYSNAIGGLIRYDGV